MKEKIWIIPEEASIPEALLLDGCAPLLAAVLASRGVTVPRDARAFLYDGPFETEDPFLLTDMRPAVERIMQARDRGETVAVYGDYDVDGITATCLLTDHLRLMGLKTERYIPDRLEEGYGVNRLAIDRLREKGVDLIVTVDCGITAVEEAEYAASLGMDMIITDHHECQAKLPRAVAVVDPKRPDSAGADRGLAGVGVAFKLACALAGGSPDILDRYADLVAIGTIADVMPLTGENRQIVKAGLNMLRSSPRPGLAALMELSGANAARLGANTVGFTLAPRINAAGRLGQVLRAADLVMERDPDRAAELAEELCDMNRRRQQLEAEIWDQAVEMLDGQTVTGPIVLAREGWHQGVIGIVASRLSEAYQMPTVMISLEGDKGKGSCRSWSGFNLFDALSACEAHLESFGGHALAAGLNVRPETIDSLRRALHDYYQDHIPQGDDALAVDLNITQARLLSLDSVESLDALEPFGNGNPRPVLCLTDAVLTDVASIGGGKHVRFTLEKFGQRYGCVWFSHRTGDLPAQAGDRVDAAFYPKVNEYKGRRSVQLEILDMRRTDLEQVCRNILTGGSFADHRITRTELVMLWRALQNKCPCKCRLSRLGSIEPRLRPAQIALGLRVLSELDLAGVQLDGQDIHIMLIAWEVKTDLNRSRTWVEMQG